MNAIEVRFAGDNDITTVVVSNIRYIIDEDTDNGPCALLIFMDGVSQLLEITREQVTELINRRKPV